MRRHFGAGFSGVVLGILAACVPAGATDGYFQVGFGARQNGMGGAGVADSTDAMAQTLNPAGIVGVGDQWQVGGTIFMPFRGYATTGTGPNAFVAPGPVESDSNFFLIPNFAYTRQIDSTSAWGISVYGNGGMNTNYPAVPNASNLCATTLAMPGVFCMGPSGVDLIQAFASVDYAKQIGSLKVGVAPTLAVQRFKAAGIGAFAPSSSDMANFSDNGYDYSFGGGLRAGLEWQAMPGLRFGLSGQTKMYMTRFDKYAGLFAEQGGFDIPAAVTAGVSFDAAPDLTLSFDYQRIFYSGVPAIANSMMTSAFFGDDDGPGFGWTDVDVFKIGAEWQASDKWTVRAGYAYSDNPIGSDDVTLNILAPGVTQHHITAGASFRKSERDTIEFFAMYVPETTVTGPEFGASGPTGQTLTLNMHQFQAGFGWTRKY